MNSQDKKSLVNRLARGKEDVLIEKYISVGPTKLKDELSLETEEWKVIFDYLVFEHNLLYKCVSVSCDFFKEIYIKNGMTHVREILDILEPKYDLPFEVVFDFLVVSNDALIYHVMEHRKRYTVALRARGADFVRKVLGIWKEKYDGSWEKVLDFLLRTVCDGIFSEQTYEQGIKVFSGIMNAVREHRPIYKSGLII